MPPGHFIMDKQTLRQNIRQKREALSAQEVAAAGARVAQKVIQLPIYQEAKRIAVYLAHRGELAPRDIVNAAWVADKTCFLPVLDPQHDKQLCFLPYTPGTALSANTFGIDEPVYHANQVNPASSLDLIFLPLVAFDAWGNRLGMGQGYYDRTLAFRKQLKRPYLIGLAYDFQYIAKLDAEEWDIALDMVITPKKIIENPVHQSIR